MAITRKLLLVLLALWTPNLSVGSQDVILKPIKAGQQPAAMVLVPGPGVKPEQYKSLAEAVQAVSPLSLWVAIPEFPLDMVLGDLAEGISRVLLSLRAGGLASDAPLFLAAHSPLSAEPLQTYLLKNATLAASMTGQVLLGSFLQRVHRQQPYPVKTLTVGAELDGVCRVTRIMEEYYHRVLTAKDPNTAASTYPVVVVRGMTHSLFASGGMPAVIRDLDFRAEISYDDAHKLVANIVSDFVLVAMGNTAALPSLTAAVKDTGLFFQPLIRAYQLEGSYKLKPPCLENPPSPACQVGCPWTQSAMVMMAQLPQGNVNDTDQIHPASEIFPKIHHPSILTNCSSPAPSCTVQVSSVSECVYHDDKLDYGDVANSANEIRAKLKSRQSVMMAAGYGNVDFNTSDAGSRCKTINQQAYEWALQNSDPQTLARFREFGVAMVMGEDKGCLENGGLWIYLPMDYTSGTNSTGGETLVLQSIQLKTPVTYSIGLFAGMHYCKLLSPARAMEWVYVDGLRRYYTGP